MPPPVRMPAALPRLAVDRGGFSAVLTALMLTILLGFIGLGVDIGMWQWLQRDMQEAADHAAFAAASTQLAGHATAIQTGLSVAVNGLGLNSTNFTADPGNDSDKGCFANAANNNLNICIEDALVSGYYNNLGWTVIISQTRPMFFTRVLFSQAGNISASAVASPSSVQGYPCVVALDASASGALRVSGGGADLSLTNCDASVASTATDALQSVNGASVSAQHIYVEGNEDVDSSSSISPAEGTTQNQTHVAGGNEFGDFYAGGLMSAAPTGCDYNFANGGNQGPGVYCGGDFAISGGTTTTLSAGLYVLWGAGLSVSGGTLAGTCPAGETYASSTNTCNDSGGSPTSDQPGAPWSCSGGGLVATAGATLYLIPSNATLQTYQQSNPQFAGSSASGDSVQITGCFATNAPRSGQFGRSGCIGSCSTRLPRGQPSGYEGLAVWVDRSMDAAQPDQIGSGAEIHMQGAFYDPVRTLAFSSGGGLSGSCTQVIADKIALTAPATTPPATKIGVQFPIDPRNICSAATDPTLQWPTFSTLGPVALTE